MNSLKWWLRIVGAVYLLDAVMKALVLAPIRTLGGAAMLERAAAGEPTARLLVDTWVGFGLETGAIGAVLLVASRNPQAATWLVWLVVAVELLRGIAFDIYMLARGHAALPFVVWVAIHAAIVAGAIVCLRSASRRTSAVHHQPDQGAAA